MTKPRNYLHRLEVIPFGDVDGTETFQSSGLFPGGVQGLPVPGVAKGKPTLATKATIFQMVVDGILAELFGSLGENRRCWTEGQVVQFCRVYRDKLASNGCATFFEMEGGVVAIVGFNDDTQLRVYVDSSSLNNVWHTECQHRFISLLK